MKHCCNCKHYRDAEDFKHALCQRPFVRAEDVLKEMVSGQKAEDRQINAPCYCQRMNIRDCCGMDAIYWDAK